MKINKVVLDTNVLISGITSPNNSSPNRELLLRFRNKEFIFLFSEDTLAEYILKFEDLGVDEEEYTDFLGALFALGEEVFIESFHFIKYPVDADDIAFFLCAINGKAEFLISYDKHLLDLQPFYTSLNICEPVPFLKLLKNRR